MLIHLNNYHSGTNLADNKLMAFFLFFPENRIWYIMMQTVSIGESLHKICQNLFSGQNKKNISKWYSGGFRSVGPLSESKLFHFQWILRKCRQNVQIQSPLASLKSSKNPGYTPVSSAEIFTKSVTFSSCGWWLERIFSQLISKFYF